MPVLLWRQSFAVLAITEDELCKYVGLTFGGGCAIMRAMEAARGLPPLDAVVELTLLPWAGPDDCLNLADNHADGRQQQQQWSVDSVRDADLTTQGRTFKARRPGAR